MNETELVEQLASGYFLSWKNKQKNTTQFAYMRQVQDKDRTVLEQMKDAIPHSKIYPRLDNRVCLVVYQRSSLHLIANLIAKYFNTIAGQDRNVAERFLAWVKKMEEYESELEEKLYGKRVTL